MTKHLDRRDFLRASAAGAAFLSFPSAVRARDASGKLRVASIGTGNQGHQDLEEVAASDRVEVTALCNVDRSKDHLGWAVERYPKAKVFVDYRRLFDEAALFDAVIVSTPDHMHAPIALAAMELGKHVYCEKPLAHTVSEARAMREAAERHNVVTQMGNQIQSNAVYRNAVKLVRDGAIGKVREVHAWQSGKPPWKFPDAETSPAGPPPADLDWDLWLGVAPARPYISEIYHPRNWRIIQDFGTGQLGDFGCHILDPVFQALELTAPVSIEADAPPLDDNVWAKHARVSYRFPGTARTDGNLLPLTWRDGPGNKPNRSELGLPDSFELPDSGSVMIGEAGTLVLPHYAEAKLFPEEKFKDRERPQLEDVSHYTSWAHACLGDGKTTSNFSYAGPLTEAVLLGVVAIRFPGESLQWDANSASFKHHADANARLTKKYRAGWST